MCVPDTRQYVCLLNWNTNYPYQFDVSLCWRSAGTFYAHTTSALIGDASVRHFDLHWRHF